MLIDSGSDVSYATVKGDSLLRSTGAMIHSDGTLEVRNPSIGSYPVVSPHFYPWGSNQDTMAEPSDGILGLDFLECYRMGLDFRAKTMRLWRNDVDLNDAPYDWLDRTSGKPPNATPGRVSIVRCTSSSRVAGSVCSVCSSHIRTEGV